MVRTFGRGMFQFYFENEEDIEGVLKLQPYHFDYWMIALAKWQPQQPPQFPSEIPFRVRILGVPTEFRTFPTVERIGNAIGKTIEVDLEQMRVLVVVDAFQELCFETTVDFKGGEFYNGKEAPISLRFEKLYGYCETCGSLCHKDDNCPLTDGISNKGSERKQELREGNGGSHEEVQHDDRARSFKGVVLNGSGRHMDRERDGRDYYGKGKGNMLEANDSKWVKVADRGTRRAPGLRGNYNGDGEPSRHRLSNQERGSRVFPEHTRGPQIQQDSQSDAREEGEIMNGGEEQDMLPSKAFQDQLSKTQADGPEVISDPKDREKGLQQLQGLAENEPELGEEEAMEWDDIKALCRENGFDVDAADGLPDLSEEEAAAVNLALEEKTYGHDTGEIKETEKEKAGEEFKRHATKKKTVKPNASNASSNKMRIASALASPRKRAQPKHGHRQGDSRTNPEGKVPSQPSPDHMKP